MKIDHSLTSWLTCKRCALHKTRTRVVLGRGSLPCVLLFIGEAPGKSEDLIGKPFIGPSGKLLDKLIARAAEWAGLTELPAYYITNSCACRPTDSIGGDNRAPTPEERWACFPRLELEAKRLAQPRRVIFLGKIAQAAAGKLFPDGVGMFHPAYVLRSGGMTSPAGVKFCRDLAEILKEIANEEIAEEESTAGIRHRNGSVSNDVERIRALPRRVQINARAMGAPGAEARIAIRQSDARTPGKVVRKFQA